MYDGMDRPLFGEARPRDRYLNYFIGGATVLLVCVAFNFSKHKPGDPPGLKGPRRTPCYPAMPCWETLISSLVFPSFPPTPINVFLAFIIALICISELTLIYWYRQGDVDPKFRKMIYFNSFTTVLLCICANVYFHKHLSS